MPNHRNVYISLATSMSKTGKFQLTPLVLLRFLEKFRRLDTLVTNHPRNLLFSSPTNWRFGNEISNPCMVIRSCLHEVRYIVAMKYPFIFLLYINIYIYIYIYFFFLKIYPRIGTWYLQLSCTSSIFLLHILSMNFTNEFLLRHFLRLECRQIAIFWWCRIHVWLSAPLSFACILIATEEYSPISHSSRHD